MCAFLSPPSVPPPPPPPPSPPSIIGRNPPDLHRDRLDGVRDPVLSPGVPQDVHPLSAALLRILRGAVEVRQAALVEPPPRLVVLGAAALHRAVVDGAGGIAAVVVHVRGAERSRVLVLLLLVATKCITWTNTHTHGDRHFSFQFALCGTNVSICFVLPALPAYLPRCILKNWVSLSRRKSSYDA